MTKTSDDSRETDNQSRKLRLTQIGLLLFAVVLAFLLIKPAAPTEIWLLTGPDNSVAQQFGVSYAEFLEDNGVIAHVVTTEGPHDNLRRLGEFEGAAVAFTHSGVGSEELPDASTKGVVSLASLSFEPIWFFVRAGMELTSPADLVTRKMTVGLATTGAEDLASILLKANGQTGTISTIPLLDEGGDNRKADCDVIIAIGPPDLPVVAELLSDLEFSTHGFDRARAYQWRFPYLGKVTVPEGALSLGRNSPETDIELMAVVTVMVARKDLHPAMVDLLLDGARRIHRSPRHFREMGKFPGMDHLSLPLDPAAEHYFEDGHSSLRKILPFRLATLVDRFLTALAAIAGAAIALFSILPRLITLPLKIKLNKAMKRLVKIEMESATGGDPDEMVARVDELDAETINFRVPMTQQEAYLNYRQCLFDSRERFRQREV